MQVKLSKKIGWEGLYRDPRHPYTVMLLEAVKKLQGAEASPVIPMETNGASDESLCKFLVRCPSVRPVCREKPPQYIRFPSGKRVLCNGLGKQP